MTDPLDIIADVGSVFMCNITLLKKTTIIYKRDGNAGEQNHSRCDLKIREQSISVA